MRRPLYTALIAASFLVSFLLAAANPAGAIWARRSVAHCLPDYKKGTFGIGLFFGEPFTTSYATIRCAVVDTDSFPKASIGTLRLYLSDASEEGAIGAQVCVSFWDGRDNGGTCSNTATNGSPYITGDVSLNLGAAARTVFAGREGDFGFIYVRLPPPPSTDQLAVSVFQGFLQSNP